MKARSKLTARSLRNFFVKEPKFSVVIALTTIVVLLLLYFHTNMNAAFSLQEKYQTSLVAQKDPANARPSCKLQHTVIIWEEMYLLPAN